VECRNSRREARDSFYAKEVKLSAQDEQDTAIYTVVVNDEQQYSIWPADQSPPLGWQTAAMSGTRAECLAYIGRVWTDMRPLSVRKRMETAGQDSQNGAI
jgi:MbtH protein